MASCADDKAQARSLHFPICTKLKRVMPSLKHRSEWLFDVQSSSFLTDSALIRIVALPAEEAARLPNAMQRAEALTQLTLDRTGFSAISAKQVATQAFTEAPGAPPSRTVLVYQYTAQDDAANEAGIVAAFTRVYASDSNVYISTISDDPDMPEAVQKEVLQALAVAMETLAEDIARHELQSAKGFQDKPLLIQRGLLGASDFQKNLYEDAGYSVALTDRIEMTAAIKDVELSSESPNDAIEGIEIRALDILNDDLVQVYDLLKVAFGSNPPSYEAWKRHYWQQPRLAADLSFVAWYDSQPVSAVLIERLAEGEGGGDDELEAVFHTERQLSEEHAEAETNTVDNNTRGLRTTPSQSA